MNFNANKSRLLEIGRWPTTDNVISKIFGKEPLLQQFYRRRADLHTTERDMGVFVLGRLHTSNHSVLHPVDQVQPPYPFSLGTAPATTFMPAQIAPSTSHARDYYRFEWFWLLEITALIEMIQSAGVVIARSYGEGYTFLFCFLAWDATFVFCSMLLYAFAFILLTQVHKPFDIFLTRQLRFSRPSQKTCLRYATFSYSLLVIGGHSYILFILHWGKGVVLVPSGLRGIFADRR